MKIKFFLKPNLIIIGICCLLLIQESQAPLFKKSNSNSRLNAYKTNDSSNKSRTSRNLLPLPPESYDLPPKSERDYDESPKRRTLKELPLDRYELPLEKYKIKETPLSTPLSKKKLAELQHLPNMPEMPTNLKIGKENFFNLSRTQGKTINNQWLPINNDQNKQIKFDENKEVDDHLLALEKELLGDPDPTNKKPIKQKDDDLTDEELDAQLLALEEEITKKQND